MHVIHMREQREADAVRKANGEEHATGLMALHNQIARQVKGHG